MSRTIQQQERTRDLVAAFLSPATWAAHFLLSYATAAVWCARFGNTLGPVRIAVAAYTIVALAIIVITGLRGYRRHEHPTETPPHDADTPEDRTRFLGLATALLSALSAIATIYVAAVAFMMPSCVR